MFLATPLALGVTGDYPWLLYMYMYLNHPAVCEFEYLRKVVINRNSQGLAITSSR